MACMLDQLLFDTRVLKENSRKRLVVFQRHDIKGVVDWSIMEFLRSYKMRVTPIPMGRSFVPSFLVSVQKETEKVMSLRKWFDDSTREYQVLKEEIPLYDTDLMCFDFMKPERASCFQLENEKSLLLPKLPFICLENIFSKLRKV